MVGDKLPGFFAPNRREKTIDVLKERQEFCLKVKRVRETEGYDEGIGKIFKTLIAQLQRRYRNPELNQGETAAAIIALEGIEQKIQMAIKELPTINKHLKKLEERNDRT